MIIEFIAISIIGTLLHFTYDWSKHNKIVGLFSAVNESTWEHIKLALSACFFCSVIDGFFWVSNPNYFLAKFTSLLTLIIVMPLLFYRYTAIVKKTILAIDISIFFITVACGQIIFKIVLELNPLPYIFNYLGLLGIFAIFGFYMVVTLLPIKNFIFKDPITNKYGLKGHNDTIVSKNNK